MWNKSRFAEKQLIIKDKKKTNFTNGMDAILIDLMLMHRKKLKTGTIFLML